MLVQPGSVVDTIDDPRWTPLRIVATMAEPIVIDTNRLHLDGPLSWCAYLAHQELGEPLPPMTPDQVVDFDLGLATWTRPASRSGVDDRLLAADGTSVWGWACSAAYAPVTSRTLAHTRRPVPIREIGRYATTRTINTGAGPYKARNVPHAAVFAPIVIWWCLGDPAGIAELLSRLAGLGRLSRHGHGRVLDTIVERDERAHERWRWREFPDPESRTIGSIRAPYHHPTRRMPTIRPGDPPWA